MIIYSNTIYKNDIFLKSIKKGSLGIVKLLVTLPKVERNINDEIIFKAFQDTISKRYPDIFGFL